MASVRATTTPRRAVWPYWLVLAAFVVHDAEELATMPGWVADHRTEVEALLARLGAADLAALLPSTYTRAAVAIGCVFVLFAVVTAGAALRRRSRAWRWMFSGLLGAFFLHAFTHVAQSVVLGGYTPGVVTAVAVVVPVSLVVYGRLLAQGDLEGKEAMVAGLVGAALLVPAILLAISIAAWLASE